MSALPHGGAMGAIDASQRYVRGRTCPICGGCERDRRGRSERCYGYLSRDGEYAHCTREQYAGGLAANSRTSTYAHRLHGACHCGVTHGPSLAPIERPIRRGRSSTRADARQTPPEARSGARASERATHPDASPHASLGASSADRGPDRGEMGGAQ